MNAAMSTHVAKIHLESFLPAWNSLDSVRHAHSELELSAIIFFAILVLCELLAHLTADKGRERIFETIGLCFFAIAVISEALAYEYGRRNDELSQNVIDSLDSKAKDADERAAGAAQAAHDARLDADQAKDDLAMLQSLVSGRQIFDTKPLRALQLKGELVYVESGDAEEAKSFCRSISAALHEAAGVITKPMCGSTYPLTESIVRGPSLYESEALAKALAEATHFPFKALPNDSTSSYTGLRVLVGPQPSFTIKQTAKESNNHP